MKEKKQNTHRAQLFPPQSKILVGIPGCLKYTESVIVEESVSPDVMDFPSSPIQRSKMGKNKIFFNNQENTTVKFFSILCIMWTI